jgi:hypothetical protein
VFVHALIPVHRTPLFAARCRNFPYSPRVRAHSVTALRPWLTGFHPQPSHFPPSSQMAVAVPNAPGRLFLLQSTPFPNPSSSASAARAQSFRVPPLRLSLFRRMAGRSLTVIAGASGGSERDLSASAVSVEALDSVASDSGALLGAVGLGLCGGFAEC